ncbi:uncharacterized protein LOC120261995 isoform X2 [Dioscorea cayenensis subsp. rotundata]|uniref:Uncharacterized protein LOC120261995 isoform X2 n=1 Tax=Dioscorea cayennensis subsp. rotundata TaxID=55577 RepID=A0AB40BF66_DIOCR|nr:uncharacterized protein LOC120261995 isoform X2 [Dioscorea cayenensis subsp. rotundata]
MDFRNPSDRSEGSSRSTGFFLLRLLSDGADLFSLLPDRIYTVGRDKRRCDIIVVDGRRCVSRMHCQVFFDGSNGKLRLVDGFFLQARPSVNGVFLNGRRLRRGATKDLSVGDEILLGCRNRSSSCCMARSGFVVEMIVFRGAAGGSDAHKVFDSMRAVDPGALSDVGLRARAGLLLRYCGKVLQSADPVSYLRNSLHLEIGTGIAGIEKIRGSGDDLLAAVAKNYGHVVVQSGKDRVFSGNPIKKVRKTGGPFQPREDILWRSCNSNGKKLFLNKLDLVGCDMADQGNVVSLLELFHPVESLVRVFAATFTSDIPCYPPFPDIIAFGKDRKKQGVACHHPKLFVLQRESGIRVIVTSANLVSKQWKNVTNTVWFQDFLRRSSPDYSSLFGRPEHTKCDFAAQLAGFIASLIIDVPSQAHWITELAKFDFTGSQGHLVASVPGIYVQNPPYFGADHCLSAKQIERLQPNAVDFLGSAHSSVVGLRHRFSTTSDATGAQLKILASILGKGRENASGLFEVLLRRNNNIPADVNAVSVLVADLDEFSEGDCLQLGFLPRDVASWVSPLSDSGFFRFSAFIYPKEALAAALDESNMKAQLILYVSQGPKFSEISRLIQPMHVVPLCSLLASIQRCLGLWRLEEVLSQHKWPELLENDFVYASSSIGTSVSTQFLATFSSAAGKRLYEHVDSDESDPEWGCWSAKHEAINPSMKIVFPTIERVKNGAHGILPSRFMLSLSEKTWQRLRTTNIFRDAVPNPDNRIGYPMHVKIARRRFHSKTGKTSFGWIYSGSHNFSAAAWGQIVHLPSQSKIPGARAIANELSPRLHICNYELGILIVVPPSKEVDKESLGLDEVILPFVTPAPKYREGDRPATTKAMREALAEAAVAEGEISAAVFAAEDGDVQGEEEVEEEEEEEGISETAEFVAEEKEEERIYAEMLWSQMDSSES